MPKSLLLAALLGIVFHTSLPAAENEAANLSRTASAATSQDNSATQVFNEMEYRLRVLQERLNGMELQTETIQSQIDRNKPKPVEFAGGTLEVDAESHNATQAGGSFNPSWTISQGEELTLGFHFKPADELSGSAQIEAVGENAANYFHWYYEPQMAFQNKRIILKEAEVDFNSEYFLARAFNMVDHEDWHESGDLYYLFPGQGDLMKPFRYSGITIPRGAELQFKGALQGIDIYTGPQLNWGQLPEAIIKVQRHYLGMDFSIIHQELFNALNSSAGTSNMPATEFWVKIPLGENTSLDNVVLYRPVNVGQGYTYVNSVAPGTGFVGSNYQVLSGTTQYSDAVGYQARLKSTVLPLLEDEILEAEYSGLLAGDLERVSATLDLRSLQYLLFTIRGTYQKPLIGPLPLVVSPVGPVIMPRPYNAPFEVAQNPISGRNNREMTELTFTLEWNPGLGWFYRYRPAVVEDWNLNPDLKTPFSMAVSYRLFNYPTGTDLASYVGSNGILVGEAPGSTGLWPTNGFLGEVKSIAVATVMGIKWVGEVAGGNSFPSLSPNPAGITDAHYLNSALSATWGPLTLSGGLGRNVWGPEDWDIQFGDLIAFDYKAGISWSFGNSKIVAQYEGWRDDPNSGYSFPVRVINTESGPVSFSLPADQVYMSYIFNF